jgi:PPOX class probable F420-dependent enzyme
MSPLFDEQNPVHQMALRKLAGDHIAWLTTIRPDGRPHSVPVWFLWHDGQVLTFSEPGTQKTRNLRAHGDALLALETGAGGDEVVILDGSAEISGEPAAAWLDRIGEAYQTKYADGLRALGLTLEQMAVRYSEVIVLSPRKLTAW